MATSPTMWRKKLGGELRRHRVAAGISVEAAAEALDCSASRIGHLEIGRNGMRKPDLTVLADLYGLPASVRGELEEIRKRGSQRGWWATYKLPAWLQTWVGMESDATAIRVFELELVTALLQTKAYALRIHEFGKLDAESANRLADARIRRQAVLDGADAPHLFVIMSEGAILRAAAEPEFGSAQLRHLLEMMSRSNVTVRVMPISAGLHPAMSGSFHLLEFAPEVSAPVAFQEYAVGGHLVDEPGVVEKLSTLFARLEGMALKVEASRTLIERLAGEAEGSDDRRPGSGVDR